MPLPNFLVIGSSRGGTTSLYHYLREHPQVYVTPVLEPRFFAFEGDPLDYRGPGDHLLKNRVVTKFEDYLALFEGVGREIAIGEVSPAYLGSASAPACIRRYIPDAKIIAILRNPVERAISSFRLEVLEGFEVVADLAEAISLEETRMRNHWSYVWQYKQRGRYYTHLKRYFDLFPREQIRIFLFEDWNSGGDLLKAVFRFLGVADIGTSPQRIVRHNTTDLSRFKARGVVRPEISEELRTRLIDGYREEIEQLQELIGRDLSAWLPDFGNRDRQ